MIAAWAGVLALSPAACSSPNNSLPESQRAALADDFVSYDEYVDAYDNLVSCLRQRGHQVDDPVVAGTEGLYLDVSITSADLAGARTADDDFNECYLMHAAAVSAVWAESNTDPDVEAQGVGLYETVVSCLEETAGVSLGHVDPAIPEELDELVLRFGEETYDECLFSAASAMED